MNTSESKFYFAVDDVTLYKGTVNKQTRVYKNWDQEILFDPKTDVDNGKYDYRVFSPKFSKTPERAIIKAVFDTEDDFSSDDTVDMFKNMFIDPVTKCYIYYEYMTIGSKLPPKKIHMEKFLAGEYELYIYKHEIQVFSTQPEQLTNEDRLWKNKDVLKKPCKCSCACKCEPSVNTEKKAKKETDKLAEKPCKNECKSNLVINPEVSPQNMEREFTIAAKEITSFEVNKDPVKIVITVK